MAWVRFTADYDWYPRYGVTIAYKEGMTLNVPRACATLAIAAGKAVRMRKVSRDGEPTYAVIETREHVEDGWVKTEIVGEPVFLKDAPPTDVGGADSDPVDEGPDDANTSG